MVAVHQDITLDTRTCYRVQPFAVIFCNAAWSNTGFRNAYCDWTIFLRGDVDQTVTLSQGLPRHHDSTRVLIAFYQKMIIAIIPLEAGTVRFFHLLCSARAPHQSHRCSLTPTTYWHVIVCAYVSQSHTIDILVSSPSLLVSLPLSTFCIDHVVFPCHPWKRKRALLTVHSLRIDAARVPNAA